MTMQGAPAISALSGADPLAVTWSSLLLATAPALLAAAAAAGVLVLTAGIAGGIRRTGLFFVPAPAVLAAGGFRLWREQP